MKEINNPSFIKGSWAEREEKRKISICPGSVLLNKIEKKIRGKTEKKKGGKENEK